MKKLIIIITCLLLAASQADAATRLAWDHDGTGPPAGFNVYYHDINAPATEYHQSISGAAVREWLLSNARLEPGKTYRFSVTAYNSMGESGRSNTVDWTQPSYAPPADVLPPVVIVIPGASTTIRIDP
jgi:hypothetical protein